MAAAALQEMDRLQQQLKVLNQIRQLQHDLQNLTLLKRERDLATKDMRENVKPYNKCSPPAVSFMSQ